MGEATVEDDAFGRAIRRVCGRCRSASRKLPRRSSAERGPDPVALLERELAEAAVRRKLLITGPFPGMGTGDPDLYKAFCWRFWALVNAVDGRVGVVLPRSAFAAKGSTDLRRALFAEAGRDQADAVVEQFWMGICECA